MASDRARALALPQPCAVADSSKTEIGEYGLGFVNGLEYVLAMHQRRPAMYLDKDKKHSKRDMERFPEHFL